MRSMYSQRAAAVCGLSDLGDIFGPLKIILNPNAKSVCLTNTVKRCVINFQDSGTRAAESAGARERRSQEMVHQIEEMIQIGTKKKKGK